MCVTIRVLLCILKGFLFSLGIFLPWASFNPIQDGHFRGCSRMGGGGTKRRLFPKICHRYSTMMKLGTVIPYLKKIQKIYESRDTPFEFCWHKHFLTGNQQILFYTDIDCILIHDFWVFKYFFNKPGYNFDDVSKNSYPGLLKITVFWNKGYGVIISVDDVTNKALWHDSNYTVDVFMWPKFGNSSISMRDVITTSVLLVQVQ